MNKKITHIIILFIFSLIALNGCLQVNPKTEMYLDAFEQILFEDDAYLEEVDYISIFINEDDVPDNRLSYIQKTLKEKYNKKVYTYKKEEVHVSGPYGKEDLDDHGIFIYITSVDSKDDITYMTGEKHYTRKNHPSIQVDLTF